VELLGAILGFVAVAMLAAAVLSARARRRRRARGPQVPGAPRVEGLGPSIRAILAGGPSEGAWRELEDLLVRADAGPKMAAGLVSRIREQHGEGAAPEGLLVEEITRALSDDPRLRLSQGRLSVILVVGVNGSGKTTTVGKLANWLAEHGRSVSLAASDTFRAAASEQLEAWAERAGAHLVSQGRGADPGGVAFDAVNAARARGSDVLIVDTAGRLHTKTPLMDELGKIRRVIEKAGGTIDETLLVLDATTGQNGIAQARAFIEAAEVTGVALAKLDGTAKGGIVLAIREELGVPVKLVGTGEGVGDIEPFNARGFAEHLVWG